MYTYYRLSKAYKCVYLTGDQDADHHCNTDVTVISTEVYMVCPTALTNG